MDTRERLVDARLHAVAALAEALDRGGHDLLEADVAHGELEGSALQPAHVEEVADERVEPVGLLVDGREELTRRLGCPLDVLLQEARRRRLDRRQRRPQIVRHRGEQCDPQVARLRQPRRDRGLGAQLTAFEGERQLPRERLQQRKVLGGKARAHHDELHLGVDGDAEVTVLGTLGNGRTGRRLDDPAVAAVLEHGHRAKAERRAQRADEERERIFLGHELGAEARQRLRLGAGARGLR